MIVYSIVAYVVIVAFAVFLARPPEIAFPGLPFFLGYSLLPCLLSGLTVLRGRNDSVRKLALYLVVATVVFGLVWLLQLWVVAQYAVRQSNRTVEGLISNFYVFMHLFLGRGLLVALACLAMLGWLPRSRALAVGGRLDH